MKLLQTFIQKLSFARTPSGDVTVEKGELEKRELGPHGSMLSRDGYITDFLRLPPGVHGLTVRPARSASTAHGYAILSNPEYWDLLDEMYESDEILRMCLDLMVSYMLMRPQGITVGEEDIDDPQSETIKQFFEENLLDNPKVNFRYLCWSLALGMLKHGRSTVEILWGQTEEGYFIPMKFYHCHPGQFSFTASGEMLMEKGRTREPLPPYKFITAKNSSLYDNPFGDSLLFPFRFKWQYKKRVLAAKLQYLERFGTPIIHGKVPNLATDKEKVIDEFIAAIESLSNGMAIVTAAGEEIDVHQRSTSGLGGGEGVHDVIVDRLDSYFVRALLGAELTTKSAKNGTQALGSVQERTVLNKILPFAHLTCSALNLGLFDPMREMNFGVASPKVRYWMDTEESTDAKDARDTLDCAVKNGVPVAVSQAQEMLGIQPLGPDDEALKKPVTQVAVPGMPAAPPAEDEDDEDEPVRPNEDRDDDEDEDRPPFSKPPVADQTKFAQYEFQSTQLDLGPTARDIVRAWLDTAVDPADVFVDAEGRDGREYDSHVTVLYGIHPDVTKEAVAKAAVGEWWQWIMLDGLTVFELEDCDVLVTEVELTPELEQLRRAMETLPYTNNYPDYKPHMTLAYLKKGTAQKYLDAGGPLDYWIELCEWLTFSTVDGMKFPVALTGPYVEMKPGLEGAIEQFEAFDRSVPVALKRTHDPKLDLWQRQDATGEKFRAVRMAVNREAEKQGHDWERSLVEAAFEDTHAQLFTVMKDTANRLEKRGRDQRMSQAMRSDVDIQALEVKQTAKRIVYSTFMIRQFIGSQELKGIRKEQPKFWQFADQFDDNELIDLLPEGFRDAAEWMASRGVMTITQVRELAKVMAEQFGGTAKEWEANLRDEYLALSATAETGATKKIQGVIENAVKKGLTLAEFLDDLSGMIDSGDLPGGMESYWETVFRTEVGNAYKKAQILHESDPDFEPYHWGWEGYNPQDDRSEPSHAAIDGKKFKKGSKASLALGMPPFRFNCRCAMFALTMPDPERPGHKESRNALSIASKVSRF